MSLQKIPADEYKLFIQEIKQRVKAAQIKAAVSVNREMLLLYWDLGQQMIAKQQDTAWGDGFIKQMSKDLKTEFPDMKGFSVRNLEVMRQWVRFWQGHPQIAQQVAAQLLGDQSGPQITTKLMSIPWWHHVVILSKIKNHDEALILCPEDDAE
jgi:predicted nuclease of restriction endonuclease-like (RecB) superfamily